jgi:hypothetical protein
VKLFFRRHGARLVALLVLIGHFAPWAQHRSAALTLSAHELSIFTHYTPHAGVFFNEGFLLPLWAAALLMALPVTGDSPRRRLGFFILALLVAMLALPGYPELRNLLARRGSPFVLQFVISLITIGLAAWLAFRTQAARVNRMLTLVAAIAAAAAALIGFAVIRGAALETLYRDTVGFGWGWWLTLFSTVALSAIAFVTIFCSSGFSSSPAQTAH